MNPAIDRKKQLTMGLLGKVILLAIITLVGISIVAQSINYFTPDFGEGYLSDKQEIFNGIFSIGLYLHITVAPMLIVLGSIQAFRRNKSDNLHLVLGKIYAVGVLLVGGPSGIILSFYAFGGLAGKINFLVLSVLWMFVTWRAYHGIKNGNKAQHAVDAISSYVLLLSAILLRILSFMFVNFTNLSVSPNAYVIISLLSWLPTFILIRVILSGKEK